MPAESEADRAERQAEAQFQELVRGRTACLYCLHVPPACTAGADGSAHFGLTHTVLPACTACMYCLQELMDLPHASTQDLEAQRQWEQGSPESRAGNAAIEGDAPVAGGGLQVGAPAVLQWTEVVSPECCHSAALGCFAADQSAFSISQTVVGGDTTALPMGAACRSSTRRWKPAGLAAATAAATARPRPESKASKTSAGSCCWLTKGTVQ